mmetsp:Transcript_2967/g.6285  ORF Transcript_2967/g.6285 Transcript_2967/m.6285 type:complete len:84 (+) Transcript_2967:1633-1884(+)
MMSLLLPFAFAFPHHCCTAFIVVTVSKAKETRNTINRRTKEYFVGSVLSPHRWWYQYPIEMVETEQQQKRSSSSSSNSNSNNY